MVLQFCFFGFSGVWISTGTDDQRNDCRLLQSAIFFSKEETTSFYNAINKKYIIKSECKLILCKLFHRSVCLQVLCCALYRVIIVIIMLMLHSNKLVFYSFPYTCRLIYTVNLMMCKWIVIIITLLLIPPDPVRRTGPTNCWYSYIYFIQTCWLL